MLRIEPDCNWIHSAAEKFPDTNFIITSEQKYTYTEVFEKSVVCADYFQKQGVTTGSNTGILLNNSPELIIALLGLWHIGAIPIILSPFAKTDELISLIYNADINYIISNGAYRLWEKLSPKFIDFNSSFNNIIPSGNIYPNYSGNALIMFTSGTTNRPKPVVLSFDNLYSAANNCDKLINHRPSDLWLASLPFHHIGGFSIIVRALLSGVSLFLTELFDTNKLTEIISMNEISFMSIVPTMMRRLVEINFKMPECVKAVFIGGAAAQPELIEEGLKLNFPIFKVYGSTETSAMATAFCVNDYPEKIQSVGKPLSGINVETGQNDEIIISGETISSGYYKNPAETERKFTGKKYKTGDAGWIDNEGFLYVRSRLDDIINSGGEKIAPGEIKKYLEKLHYIRDAYVFGMPDAEWGEIVTAVISVSGVNPDKSSIIGFLKGQISSFKIPKKIFIAKSIPYSAAGKVLKTEILEKITTGVFQELI